MAGNLISDYSQFIKIPEQWKRTTEKLTKIRAAAKAICLLLLIIFCLIGTNFGLPFLMIQKKIKPFFIILGTLLTIYLCNFLNQLPKIFFALNTMQPFFTQLFTVSAVTTVQLLLYGTIFSLFVCMMFIVNKTTRLKRSKITPWIGAACGSMLYGIYSIIKYLSPSLNPPMGDYAALNSFYPLYFVSGYSFVIFIRMVTTLFLLWLLCTKITNNWRENKIAGTIFMGLCGIIVIGFIEIITIPAFLIGGLLIGLLFALLYHLVLHKDVTLLPFVAGTPLFLYLINQALLHSYLQVALCNLLAMCVIIFAAYHWFNQIGKTA